MIGQLRLQSLRSSLGSADEVNGKERSPFADYLVVPTPLKYGVDEPV